jgi:excisionase family DNA binding protein
VRTSKLKSQSPEEAPGREKRMGREQVGVVVERVALALERIADALERQAATTVSSVPAAALSKADAARFLSVDEEGETVSNLPPSPYLTAIEAAAYLRTTLQAIYGLVKRGRIKPMSGRPGRLLFKRQDLADYLNGRCRR